MDFSNNMSLQEAKEECKRLKDLVLVTENQLKCKIQELADTKNEYEYKISNLYIRIGEYITGQNHYLKEIENLKSSLEYVKENYMKATDTGIHKATQIEDLYSVINAYRAEINSLRGQISNYQNEVLGLEHQNQRLSKLLNSKKQHKFIQTDQPTLNSSNSTHSSLKSVYFSPASTFKSLSLDCTSNKVKSQILSLQQSKARLDTQIKLLSNLT